MTASPGKESFDVIIVGAGPAGSAAALLTARAGLKVLLLERGEYPGAKNVSGAVFYGSAILNELIPNWWEQAPVERYICRRDIAFMSPTTAVALDFRSAGSGYATAPYNGFTVLRPKFDRWLAAQAEAAGAFLLTSTVVDDVLRENGRIVGVRVRREQGEIYGKVVIACDGVNSFLAKKAGLQREFHPHELSLGVKEVIGLDPAIIRDRFHLTGDEGIAFEYLGAITEDVHGGAFLYTNRDSLSLGVIGQVSSLVERRKRPYELLERLQGPSGGRAAGARRQIARVLGAFDPGKRLGDEAEAVHRRDAGGRRCRGFLSGRRAVSGRDELCDAVRAGGGGNRYCRLSTRRRFRPHPGGLSEALEAAPCLYRFSGLSPCAVFRQRAALAESVS